MKVWLPVEGVLFVSEATFLNHPFEKHPGQGRRLFLLVKFSHKYLANFFVCVEFIFEFAGTILQARDSFFCS